MAKSGYLGSVIKKTALLLILFGFIYSVTAVLSYLEQKADCFPITMITVDEKPVKELISSVKTCSFSVESEKMTFDSSIFNHYETPPVKDIFLFYVEIPFSDWQLFSEMENAIPEANPYLLNIISSYSSSKLKVFLLAYISLFFFGLIFLLRVAPSKKDPHYNYNKVSVATSIMFLIFSIPVFFIFDSTIFLFVFFVLTTLFIAYLSVLLILHRLIFWEK